MFKLNVFTDMYNGAVKYLCIPQERVSLPVVSLKGEVSGHMFASAWLD